MDYYSIEFQNIQKKNYNDSSAKGLYFCKTRVGEYTRSKISNSLLTNLCNRINIVANHFVFFFFFGNGIQKIKAKVFAEVYFHEIGLKDSFAEKKYLYVIPTCANLEGRVRDLYIKFKIL